MIKNAIFLSCDAEIALVVSRINFVKVLNFDKVLPTVCHSEERRITLETPYRISPIFIESRV
ncbi:hypothetical protein GCM10022422_27830 [Flavobacterium ginsengisoli]|uniref:Uncharacterized protein n=1 Tax=Flavobacterium ginsengisoli TaxID=871694 RepID=A0ABP7FLP2_9FLAO